MVTTHPVLWKLWGKFLPQQNAADEPGTYHSAVFHMFDVGAVAEALLPDLAGGFASQLGAPTCEVYRWVPFLIAVHDIGKLHPGFQEKIYPARSFVLDQSNLPRIAKGDLHVDGRGSRGFDHGLQSVLVLERWLKQNGYSAAIANPLARAVGAHHGKFHKGADRREHRTSYSKYDAQGWSSIQDLALGWLANQFGAVCPLNAAPRNISSLVLALSGFTSLCDWIGSSAEDFPPTGDLVGPLDYCSYSRDRARNAVNRRGFLVREQLRTAFEQNNQCSFARLFPNTPSPRPVQEAVMKNVVAKTARPNLMIVEAPMGEGKTEAALWWAAASQSDACRGVYLALPTQATSNAMHSRFRKTLEAVCAGGQTPKIHLIHSAASLVDDRLTPNTRGKEDDAEAIDAEGWFTPRKRTLWATYAVGTIDQALMAALSVKHGFVRLAGLATKAVVIDEVHAYDVYMSTLLERLLRWLAELGTPVALLSATLPSNRRAALVAAYSGIEQKGSGPAGYPLLTSVERSEEPTYLEPAASSRSSSIQIERRTDPGDDQTAMRELVADLIDRVGNGGCIAWIQNTVDGAQRAFIALQQAMAARNGPSIEIHLFHARFPMADRQRIETDVLERFGPDNPFRPARAIVVATQVIEQSLDLDFDLLVSQFAPIDLLLQRIGRLHRHASTRRPSWMDQPRLLLLTPSPPDGRPRFGVCEHIYDRFVLLKTLLALEGTNEIELPEAIRPLVESVYDDRLPQPVLLGPAGLELGDFQDAWKKLEDNRTRQTTEAGTRLIAEPHPRDPFYESAQEAFEDRGEENQNSDWIAAVTRLGPARRAVIMLHRRDNGLFLDRSGGSPLDLRTRPSQETQRELSLRAVSLSRREVVRHLEAFEPPDGLRESPALKYHAMIELVDGRWNHPNGRLSIRLDSTLGVVYENNTPNPA
jgi:CRISPR-associated endonuclease/helicase Cas3